MNCLRSWTDRRLRWISDKIDAPLEVIPPGMLSPEVTRIILNGPHMTRLLKLKAYLDQRADR